jgi:uncharacterized membrane protein
VSQRSLSTGLGLLGLAIAVYLVAAHYLAGEVPLACVTGGIVNCEQVTSSPQSMIGPVPVAVLGVAWFCGFLGLQAARSWRPAGALALAPLVWSVAGLLVVFYLIYAELFLIGAICLGCTAVHGLVIALFLLSVWDMTPVMPGQ